MKPSIVAVLFGLLSPIVNSGQAAQPNFIIIWIDDTGYGDSGWLQRLPALRNAL